LWNESRQVLDAYHGGDAIDVGAFHGWYSVLFASRAAPRDRLVSIEPDVRALPTLHDTLAALTSISSAIAFVLPVAVGDGRPLSASFPQGDDGHPRFASDNGASGAVGTTIDTIVTALRLRPTFVKVDVEGAEHFVLQGMLNTLRDYHPSVMLELHPYWQPAGVSIEDLRELLVGNGYSAVTLDVADVAVRELWSPRCPTPSTS
jgi:FkbM family methyltransferase